MRLRTFTIIVFLFSLFTILSIQGMQAQSSVTFQVDMNGTGFGEEDVIGLRGSMTPLSWSNSLEMTDPNKDGIYTLTVIFNTGKGDDRILYKYTANDTWDNDLYGPFGNRAVTLWNTPQIQPVEKWNIVTEFSYESLLEHANITELDQWIYIIGKGKLEGKSPEDVMQDYLKFWGDDFSWILSPQMVMMMQQLRQSKYSDGYFEEIMDEANKVQFRIYKVGTYYFGNRTDNGSFKGVSQEDVNAIDKAYMEALAKAKGWKLKWEERGKEVMITLER